MYVPDQLLTEHILNLFKAVVVEDGTPRRAAHTALVDHGLILDFAPTDDQAEVMRRVFAPLPINTLFSRSEREAKDTFALIAKQVLHYIEVYGFGEPGAFELEVQGGVMLPLTRIRAITRAELAEMMHKLLYGNAPTKDAAVLAEIIKAPELDIEFDINQVCNNELKVLLFDLGRHRFEDGDDAMRYICHQATGSAMLIKSHDVVRQVTEAGCDAAFLRRHEKPLAQVFNRHKRIIMALKGCGGDVAKAVNRISRLSKKAHVPLRESINKTYIHKALSGAAPFELLDRIALRDRLKFLNLLEQKKLQKTTDTFFIRNGKAWTAEDRQIYPLEKIAALSDAVILSVKRGLSHLADKRILLDQRVHYGLPISRKQALGNLPFGTKVLSDWARISSGMYWENAWGATDLDLSAVDATGNRTGWGDFSGYGDGAKDPLFSGDLVDASEGAMEFMTSADIEYGLFVNIFTGDIGCEMELLVGPDEKDSRGWMCEPLIRERLKLTSECMTLGFVQGREFTVWSGRLNNRQVSGESESRLANFDTSYWTINQLLDSIGVTYATDSDGGKYDHDLSYAGFSLDKLEAMIY